MTDLICKTQDSTGAVCGKRLTREEYEQDGMCWHCADNVWFEFRCEELEGKEHFWKHKGGSNEQD